MSNANATEQLFELITAQITKGNAYRHLWLGDTGMGKTYANEMFIRWQLAKHKVALVLSLDNKDAHAAQYTGTCRINPADLKARRPQGDEPKNHIVFRGVAMTRKLSQDCGPDEIARLAWEIVTLRKTQILINIDELGDATNGNQAWKAKTLAATYRKGRGVGISISATTQLPQILPREAYGLSDTICLFRMAGREAAYLESRKTITKESARIIPNLGIGECLIYDKARGSLDGKIVKIGGTFVEQKTVDGKPLPEGENRSDPNSGSVPKTGLESKQRGQVRAAGRPQGDEDAGSDESTVIPESGVDG